MDSILWIKSKILQLHGFIMARTNLGTHFIELFTLCKHGHTFEGWTIMMYGHNQNRKILNPNQPNDKFWWNIIIILLTIRIL